MLRRIRLKLIRLLLFRTRDVSTILIALEITEEEYNKRYNNIEHAAYKSDVLEDACKDLARLQDDFAYMLGINNYHAIMTDIKK